MNIIWWAKLRGMKPTNTEIEGQNSRAETWWWKPTLWWRSGCGTSIQPIFSDESNDAHFAEQS